MTQLNNHKKIDQVQTKKVNQQMKLTITITLVKLLGRLYKMRKIERENN